MEAMWALRRLRADRMKLWEDVLLIEERVRGGHNGDLVGAHHALSADIMIADGIIQKLWKAVQPPHAPLPPKPPGAV